MTGTLYLCDGTEKALPPLLHWTVTRTDGTACDSFCLGFLYTAEWEEILKKAVRFRGTADGVTRIYGIVDEYEVTLSGQGLRAEVYGRGLAGVLMDNEVGLMEYYWVRLSDMVRNYVAPYGIQTEYDQNCFLTSYAVEYGTSAWKALTGFCLWAGGVQPRFRGDGTLVISAKDGETVPLQHPERVMEARWDCRRYGVYSQVRAKYAATGLETVLANTEFQSLGGQAVKRVTIPKKNSCRAGRISAAQTLKQSAEKARTLKLTVEDPFFAEPGDIVTLELKRLGVRGDFYVTEAETSQGADSGTLCRLTMAERR